MLVRTHGNAAAEHLIFDIVGTGVTENVHIVTADALFDHALGFTIAEAGTVDINQEVLPFRTGGGAHVAGHRFFGMILPLFQPAVHFNAHLFGTGHGDQPQRTNGISQK